MNKPIIILLSILLFLWLLGVSYCHSKSCPCSTEVANAAVVPPVPEKKQEIAILIEDINLDFSAKTADNLLFSKNTCDYKTPLSENLQEVFSLVAQHLNNNSNRILTLSGLYEYLEDNECTNSENLGIGRAERVQQLLIQMGAPADRIRTTSESKSSLEQLDNLIVGGVEYNFSGMEERLRANNITLYFDSNDQQISMTSEQKQYFEDLKNYLAQNPNARASVTGHTDNQGNDRGNQRLSRKRSEFVRDYMVEQGINRKQIVNKGMGSNVPIATNDTEEGRALNRRVEITIQ